MWKLIKWALDVRRLAAENEWLKARVEVLEKAQKPSGPAFCAVSQSFDVESLPQQVYDYAIREMEPFITEAAVAMLKQVFRPGFTGRPTGGRIEAAHDMMGRTTVMQFHIPDVHTEVVMHQDLPFGRVGPNEDLTKKPQRQ